MLTQTTAQRRSSRPAGAVLACDHHTTWQLGGRDDDGREACRGDGADCGGDDGVWVAPFRQGRRPNPADPPAGSAPATSLRRPPQRRLCRRRRRLPAAVETTAAAAPQTTAAAAADDRTSTGRDGATGDAAGERQRARCRRHDQHQPAAARQPAAGRDVAPAGRLARRELEPQPSRRQRERLLQRAAADDLLPVADRQRGCRHAQRRLRARVRRVRRPPHADVHAQPGGGVARRQPDHGRRLAGDVERPQRVEPGVPGRVEGGLRPDHVGGTGRRRVRGRRHVLPAVPRPRGAVLAPRPGCVLRRSGDVQHRVGRPDQQRLDDRSVRGRLLRRGGADRRARAERHLVGRSSRCSTRSSSP